MKNFCEKSLTYIHFMAAITLIFIALITILWSTYEIVEGVFLSDRGQFIPVVLQSVGAIIIAAAIIDVAQYMVEEDVFQEKELRNPEEARKTITKIMVIISIAVSIEGLVYIFKAGTENLEMLIYPASLIFVSSLSIVALGIYQKLSVSIERTTGSNAVLEADDEESNKSR
ncbi:hypothetical protein FCL40_04040 [Ferrimonas sediminicola]|uniref:Uncharacterized protein n=1 Tax=Ferrimonas sediminicola TaxID=2569538 RepID=A0A4U1BGJ0_9GAMM|nr:hypothetical protein [Ferrimonas sediminicola]TKB50335.1 hypothetical protein FCL40_04040 [Ferrimonas sediminicola]